MMTPECTEQAQRMHDRGVVIAAIARTFGVGASSVRHALDRAKRDTEAAAQGG